MIGSKSHLAGDTPSGEDIVRASMSEVEKDSDAKTAGDMGVTVTPPPTDTTTSDPDPWSWGSDDWD